MAASSVSELRLVLLGNNWSERSSVGNFILEENVFNSQREPDNCERVRGKLKKEFVLINTPNLLHSNTSDMQMREHVEHCADLSNPGPQVFLLVLDSEDFTEDHKLRLCRVLELLGDQSFARSLILISGENYRSQIPLKDMIRKCSYRYLELENLEMEELLTRLHQTQTQVEIIMKEKEEEMKRKEESLRREHKDNLNTMKRIITELKGENERERKLRANERTENDKCINKEREERKRQREEDEKRWKKQKETLREECRKKVEASEKKAHSEREQREAAERKLEQCRKDIKRSQEAWDKEKKELWEQRHEDLKQNLEAEKTRSIKLHEEFYRRRKTWMASCFILTSLSLSLLIYIFHLRD
ncbi:GTPase IMAP family member 4-like isoform X2 [Solea solea]|uniref:GTPase IMAP family member 4-like isoform X2 n=1 Tax=Solea solea TaxID=90069 RepID=UPI00272BDEA1|nr:GTPase IMAP family member 4-like isoform X2 [Solea solea]XP_058492524.1 GTPase IMAP family member 4-like isoform X2 [Solea solea]